MKAISIGDVHLADKTPKFRKDNYKETGLNELRLIRAVCIENNVDVALCTGDIFHDKSATKNSHSLVKEAIHIFASFPCPVYSVVGNHDIAYNRLESLTKQPLGVLFESGALKRLDRITVKGVDIVGIHFDEKNTYETLYTSKHEDRPLIAVCHALANPEGGDFFGEQVFSYNQLAEQGSPDVYVFGHFHQDQGIQTVGKKQFINLGAIARGALNKDNVDRQVKVGLIQYTKTFKCSEIPLNVLPGDEIFNIERKNEIEETENKIEEFVKSLATNALFENLEKLEDNIRGMRLDAPIKSRLCQYLNNRGADVHI